MKKNKKLFLSMLAFCVLAVIVIGMAIVYNQFKPEGTKGSKEIVVEVVIPNEESSEFTLNTDAEFLRQALEEDNLVKGSESEYGLFITEVNGHVAEEANQEWWCITKNGELINEGVDNIAIADEEHYELTLTVGY